MKNSTYTQTIFILFLILFSSFASNSNHDKECYDSVPSMEEEELSRVATVRICKFAEVNGFGGSCAADSWLLVAVNECEGYIQGEILATNLASNPIPDSTTTYSLPADAPELFVRSSYSQHTGFSVSLNDLFVYKGDQHQGLDGQLYDLFVVDVIIPVDISESCHLGNIATVPMDIALVDAQDNLYPVDDFSEPHESFSCKVFAETCSMCFDNNCGHKDIDPFYEGTACGECSSNECSYGRISSPNELVETASQIKDIVQSRNENSSIITKTSFSIQPNPFSDYFTIQSKVQKEMQVQIEIFDANGQRVYLAESQILTADHPIELSNTTLNSGVYFCKITTPTESFIQKIIKLK